jgi:hypothetical protein
MTILRRRIVFAAIFLSFAIAGVARAEDDSPVKTIPAFAMRFETARGPVAVPIERSQDWSHPLPGVTRAVILVHGLRRNVESAYRTLEDAQGKAHAEGRETILIAPQFLNELDTAAHSVPAEVIRWRKNSWEGGEPAISPAPLTSFDVLDAMIAVLTDRSRFPNLQTVVLAGHSAGAQLVQRYAVAGKGEKIAAASGVHMRFVVANPSSYLYFTEDRPVQGTSPSQFAPFSGAGCKEFNRWKYGPDGAPAYVLLQIGASWPDAETAYAARNVVYLLGTSDTDPNHPELDRSCAGEAEGPTRFARGQAYYAYLHSRHSAGWNQHMWFVPHVGHDAAEMFTSSCGLAALFDRGSCQDQ